MPLGMKSEKMPLFGALKAVHARVELLRKGFEVASPDLIVSFLTRTNIFSLLAARKLGIPVIVSERNNPAMQTVGPFWSRLRKWTYPHRSEEHTSELQSLMRISYAVLCWKKKQQKKTKIHH